MKKLIGMALPLNAVIQRPINSSKIIQTALVKTVMPAVNSKKRTKLMNIMENYALIPNTLLSEQLMVHAAVDIHEQTQYYLPGIIFQAETKQ